MSEPVRSDSSGATDQRHLYPSRFFKWLPWVLLGCAATLALGLGALFVIWRSQYLILEQQADMSATERRQAAVRIEAENIIDRQEIKDLSGPGTAEAASNLRVNLGLGGDGSCSIDGSAVQTPGLVAALRTAAAGRDATVVISADEAATVKMLESAMAACREAGLTHFVIQKR